MKRRALHRAALAAGLLTALPRTMAHAPDTPPGPTPDSPDSPGSPGRPDAAVAAGDDPFLWLEEVQSDRALAWVRERNAQARAALAATPEFDALRARLRAVLDAADRIPAVVRRGPWLYNFWRDAAQPRGLWRRTTLDDYRRDAPAWQTLLDLDALAAQENENWVWKGAACLAPDYRLALVSLSRGGADAVVVREFDLESRRFVDGGFRLEEAKSDVEWIDRDQIFVGTDTGPGSLTDAGYPRTVRRWRRGEPFAAATLEFEGEAQDVAVSLSVDDTPGFERIVFGRALDFYRQRLWLQQGARRIAIDKPDDATLSFWRRHVLVELRSDWPVGGRVHPRGALLAIEADAWLAGRRDFVTLFTPTASRSLAGWTATRSTLLLQLLDDVAGRLEEWRPVGADWARREVQAPFPGTLGAASLHDPHVADDPLAERYLLSYTDFLTPDSLLLARTGSDQREPLKARGAHFDAAGMKVEQFFATSKDGTRVPYFVVWPRGARADGDNPTLLYGYGGFEVSLNPWYSAGFGLAWYGRGGVMVVANIRGGGEYGPAWHQAAVKAGKQRSYDDFIAVAEDLVARRITRPRRLGIMGGSNGGLLVGAVMLQRPELFNAVVCQVPLLDMKRYHRLLAGASWMAEYGDPDRPEEWAWISRYSPYQNARAGLALPRVLIVTSTRDDRVHPGHARKMAARLSALGHEVLYHENTEGGHAGAADNAQTADLQALEFSYLWQQLGGHASA